MSRIVTFFFFVRNGPYVPVFFHPLDQPQQYFIKKLKNVSCEYDRWVVETQLCKLRDTSDTLIGRACAMFHL